MTGQTILPPDESGRSQLNLPPRRRIFTNRNLRMAAIEAIGFDMDHTLAVYNTAEFNHLCFEHGHRAPDQRPGLPRRHPPRRSGSPTPPSAAWSWTRTWATC